MGPMSMRLAAEVRHSLHSVLGFLELAAEDPLSNRQFEYLAQCRAGADRLLRIASDLWELGQADLSPATESPFQIAAAITEVADVARVFAERKGLAFECTLAAGSELSILGVRGLIQDTLLRVLDNAVQFTESGSIRVSAYARANGEEAKLVLEVADSGRGMPEDVLAALRSDDEKLPDRGLSLAVVRRRIARARGEFSVLSNPGAGTIVRLTIPARLAPQEAAGQGCVEGETKLREHGGLSAKRLLVVEDSDDSFFLLQGYLSDHPYRITRASDGAEAVRLAKTGEFDLVVMDANMPVLDGYSATRAIREWESSTGRARRMPVLLFSADDPLKQAKLGGAAGCSGYLAKPATKAEVLRALDYFAPHQAGAA